MNQMTSGLSPAWQPSSAGISREFRAPVFELGGGRMSVAPAAPPVNKVRRAVTMAIAVVIQAAFVAGLMSVTGVKMPTRTNPLMMINITTQELKAQELPPPPPPMAQPQVAVTLPYIPDIAPDVPPPAPVNSAAITATPTRSTPAAPVYSAEPYETVILRYINSHMRYPTAARARRQEGTVYVRVVMDRAGRVLSSQVERSSRFTTLDEEGLALLQRAQPLPAPPASVAGDSFQFVIPIVFRLRS